MRRRVLLPALLLAGCASVPAPQGGSSVSWRLSVQVDATAERPAQSLVITQVYDPIIASDTKLMLMEFYPDEYEVTYIHNLALPDESIRKIPLYELDRQKDVDHLTSLFVPAQ